MSLLLFLSMYLKNASNFVIVVIDDAAFGCCKHFCTHLHIFPMRKLSSMRCNQTASICGTVSILYAPQKDVSHVLYELDKNWFRLLIALGVCSPSNVQFILNTFPLHAHSFWFVRMNVKVDDVNGNSVLHRKNFALLNTTTIVYVCVRAQVCI